MESERLCKHCGKQESFHGLISYRGRCSLPCIGTGKFTEFEPEEKAGSNKKYGVSFVGNGLKEKAGDILGKVGARASGLIGSKGEDMKKIEAWESLEVPEEKRKEMAAAFSAYLEYCASSIRGEVEYDQETAKKLYAETKKFNVNDFPSKAYVAAMKATIEVENNKEILGAKELAEAELVKEDKATAQAVADAFEELDVPEPETEDEKDSAASSEGKGASAPSG